MTSEQGIEIAQHQDATADQVGYMRPEFKGDPLQMEVHKIQGAGQSEAKRDRQQQGFSAQPLTTGRTDRKQRKSKRATCLNCGAGQLIQEVSGPKRKLSARNVGKKGITIP